MSAGMGMEMLREGEEGKGKRGKRGDGGEKADGDC